MLKPLIPANETARQQALLALNMLDSPSEERIDRLTRIAQYCLQAPIALVSLVDAERTWFKSRQGLDISEFARNISFCGHAILGPEVFVIPDAADDSRFADNPLVIGAPDIRFYAGAPLTLSNGLCIGTLCAMDHEPRQVSAEQLAVLRDLAQCVIEELERVQMQPHNTELALIQSKYAAIIESSDDAIMSKTLDGIITSFNPAAEKLFGYSEQEVIGQPMTLLIPPERIYEEALILGCIGRGERVEHFETVRLRKDGRPVDVLVSISPIRNYSGSIIGASKIVRDISGSKQKENDFDKISRLNQAVIEGADHIIITTDAQGIIQSFNRAAEASLGYHAEELIGKLTPAVFHDLDEIVLRAQELTNSGLPVEPGFEVFVARSRSRLQNRGDMHEWTYVHKDGTRFPVSLTVTALRNSNGEITAFLGIATNISELKHNAEELNKSSQLVKSIVETVVDGIITIDSQGIVLSFNTAAERLFGYSQTEIIGTNVNKLMPEPYAAKHNDFIARYLRTREARVIGIGREVVGLRKDGSIFPMDLAVSEMQHPDRTLFVGIVRNITERKQMERMKSEFVSTVSHELRTPLTSIRGALGLVIGKFSNGLPDKARQLLETASRNSERLTLLINDILDLEKIEAGMLALEFKALDLVAITQKAIIANEGYGHQHEVHLHLVNTLESASVWADEHRLLQVFSNLISNAIKYSPTGGTVVISVCRRVGRFRVSVRNCGHPIPEEFRHRIFQRFAQADSSDTREKGGTGLGLSIAKAIVERHGGYIDFTSEEGVGTEFFFDLPEWQEVIEQATAAYNRPRMLICEDNPDVAMVLSELLEQEGVSSDLAATGAAALAMLKRKRYRGLLLDLGLPDMDGMTLIQQLRCDKETQSLPVIIVSGRPRGNLDTWNGQALAVLDWLQKPVDCDRLRNALKQVLHDDKRPHVLHVEDDLDIVQVIQALLEEDCDYTYATSLAEAGQKLAKNQYDLLLLDLTLLDGSGLELLDVLNPNTKVIVFSGLNHGNADTQLITAALTKATASNEQLLAVIKQAINPNRNQAHE